jgi:hypothetical protein
MNIELIQYRIFYLALKSLVWFCHCATTVYRLNIWAECREDVNLVTIFLDTPRSNFS